VPAAGLPAGELPAGELPAGELPAGELPAADPDARDRLSHGHRERARARRSARPRRSCVVVPEPAVGGAASGVRVPAGRIPAPAAGLPTSSRRSSVRRSPCPSPAGRLGCALPGSARPSGAELIPNRRGPIPKRTGSTLRGRSAPHRMAYPRRGVCSAWCSVGVPLGREALIGAQDCHYPPFGPLMMAFCGKQLGT
jgi:hypothetical protein